MKKLLILLVGILLATQVYADDSKIEVRASVNDGTSAVMDTGLITKYFTSGTRQQQTISLTASAYNTFTVPSGARAILVDVLSADGIKLKGVTGDTGISLDSACPVLLPLSSDGTVTIGIQNMEAAAQTIKVYWF